MIDSRHAFSGHIPRLVVSVTIAACALMSSASAQVPVVSDVAVKAAFLYNFAKFTEWPALSSGAPFVACISGSEGIATEFVEITRGQAIKGHAIEVWRPEESATWRGCHLLFVASAATRRSADRLHELKALPVLTVSDGRDFARADGIIELYVEGGRMRFAINIDAAERSGLHLSSRLLGLAKVVRSNHVQ